MEHDARLKKICFTDKSIAIQNAMAEAMEKAEQEAMKGISQQELDIFYEVLTKIKKNLD